MPSSPSTKSSPRSPRSTSCGPTLEEIRAERLRRSLAAFLRAGWAVIETDPLQWNWHIDVLCAHVQSLLTDDAAPQNLLINVPPGTMKSLVFSVFAPAWMWLRRPSWRAIYASGSPGVVTRDSLKCRNLIRSEWYAAQLRALGQTWEVAEDQDEKQHFANTAGGFRKGVGAGGAVTGERADFLGVDDPNDAKEIWSEAHRLNINERWWRAAFHNRIADPKRSRRGIIMQRLHELDLAGYLLSTERGLWAHLCIPMEADPTSAGDKPTWLGWTDARKAGELLFPARFDEAFLAGERLSLGSLGYAGQMQQRPAPAEGAIFRKEWWRYWVRTEAQADAVERLGERRPQILPKHWDELVQSWDMSFKETKDADFVAGGVWGRNKAEKYLLERVHKRMGFVETCAAVVKLTADWPTAKRKFIEDKANGPAVIDALKASVEGIIAVEPDGSKEARAHAVTPTIEAGQVFLPHPSVAPWVGEYVAELLAFPNGANDDDVDQTTQALRKLTRPRMVTTEFTGEKSPAQRAQL